MLRTQRAYSMQPAVHAFACVCVLSCEQRRNANLFYMRRKGQARGNDKSRRSHQPDTQERTIPATRRTPTIPSTNIGATPATLRPHKHAPATLRSPRPVFTCRRSEPCLLPVISTCQTTCSDASRYDTRPRIQQRNHAGILLRHASTSVLQQHPFVQNASPLDVLLSEARCRRHAPRPAVPARAARSSKLPCEPFNYIHSDATTP
jgi:hypothetical protein